MRIIGGKDYYDSARAYGADPAHVLVRNHEQFTQHDLPDDFPFEGFANQFPVSFGIKNPIKNPIHNRDLDIRLGTVVVFFAGKIYKAIRAETAHPGVLVTPSRYEKPEYKYSYLWSMQDFEEWFEFNRKHIREDRMTSTKPRDWRRLDYEGVAAVAEKVLRVRELTPEQMKWVVDNKVSIITGEYFSRSDNTNWTINSDFLGDYEFARVLDPYTAFQELAMWVGGILPGNENPMVSISDEDRASKHGMDKWSFRRPPWKHKE